MKLFTPNNWNYSNPDLDGLLYFTQRLDEMLFHYTTDIYKAPVLNTHLLLKEYISTEKDKDISNKYLSTILEEIETSLRKDPVIAKLWGRGNVDKILETIKILPEKAVSKMLIYLNHIWGETKYYEWCIEYIKEMVKNHKQKEKIENGIKCLVPELISAGYSSEFIHYYNKIFFDQSINSVDSIDIFLSRFDRKKRTYNVYIAADNTLVKFKLLLEQRMGVQFNDDGNYAKYKHNKDSLVLHIDNIKALDDNEATFIAFTRINLFLQFYTVIDNKEQPSFQEKAMVIEQSQRTTAYIPFEKSRYRVIEGMEVNEASIHAEKTISSLISHAKCSLPKLLKAIDLHNFSLKSPDYNSSFLNLWSVLEVLKLDEIGQNDLDCIINTITPILEVRYYQTIIIDFRNKFKDAILPEQYKSMLKRINGETEDNKIAAFLLLQEYESLRIEYLDLLQRYPVLRYRIHFLSSIAMTSKDILSLGDNYKKRVTWHISRIYRIRNMITHSGESPENVKSIGEHLHYYVDLLFSELFLRFCSGTQYCLIDNVLLELTLSNEVLRKALNTKGKIEESMIDVIMTPKFSSNSEFEYTCDCEQKD